MPSRFVPGKTRGFLSSSLILVVLTGCLSSAALEDKGATLDAPPGGTDAFALLTASQREFEAKKARILASADVEAQLDRAREVYLNDPVARTRDGRVTLEAAVRSIAGAMVEWAVNADPARPHLSWVVKARHLGHDFPVANSGYGIENPDNVYRHAPVDGASRYEITGQLPAVPPRHLSFTLYRSLPGVGAMNREGSPIIGAIDRLVTDEAGRFTVTIDPDPAGDRPNHIRSQAASKLLIVRESLTDWASERPVPMQIVRRAGPPPNPPHDAAAMAALAVHYLERAVPFWAAYNQRYLYSRPVNGVLPPRSRDGGWGHSTSGHFELEPDEVLVVAVDPLGAEYLGFQLADPWGVGLEYIYRAGSRNRAQAHADADGLIRYVIAADDPGVPNWLDTGGLGRGIFAIRWQGVARDADPEARAIRDVQLVARDRLGEILPADTPRVDAAERRRELTLRAVRYRTRMSD